MPSAAPVALAIGVGYLLGRSHKLKWAVLLGTAAATGQMRGLSTQALERGTQMLRSNPELAKLTESATGLLQAGRSAAVSAMQSRAESLTDTIGDKTGQLGSVGEKATERVKPRKGTQRGEEDTAVSDEDTEDEYDEEDEYEDNDEQSAEDEEDTGDEEDEEDEAEEDEEDDEAEEKEEEPQPAARGGRQSRGSAVRRTGSRR